MLCVFDIINLSEANESVVAQERTLYILFCRTLKHKCMHSGLNSFSNEAVKIGKGKCLKKKSPWIHILKFIVQDLTGQHADLWQLKVRLHAANQEATNFK